VADKVKHLFSDIQAVLLPVKTGVAQTDDSPSCQGSPSASSIRKENAIVDLLHRSTNGTETAAAQVMGIPAVLLLQAITEQSAEAPAVSPAEINAPRCGRFEEQPPETTPALTASADQEPENLPIPNAGIVDAQTKRAEKLRVT